MEINERGAQGHALRSADGEDIANIIVVNFAYNAPKFKTYWEKHLIYLDNFCRDLLTVYLKLCLRKGFEWSGRARRYYSET